MKQNTGNSLIYWTWALIFLTGLVPFLAPAQIQSAPPAHYDELFDETGRLREQYRPIQPLLEALDKKEEKKYLKISREAFQGDNALNPVPRILTEKESSELRQGVLQRAQALVAFLKDHYSGKKLYAVQNAIPAQAIDQIIARTGESGYKGLVNPENIAFMYGPDIIRDRQGQWRVIEDNPGFIGGVGDLKLAYELSLKEYPGLAGNQTVANPIYFYQRLALALQERALSYGGKAIIYMVPPYADKEDTRIRKIFGDLGIKTVTPNSNQKLEITPKGVFTVEEIQGKTVREKVGYIFMNSEHAWVDRSHPATRQRRAIELASSYLKEKITRKDLRENILNALNEKDAQGNLDVEALEKLVRQIYPLERNHAPGLMNALLANHVGSNYSPGVDFIGDKELYVYVEDMIRFYLKQEPILKNIETQRMAEIGSGRINADVVKMVMDNPKDYVIKKVDGRGGDAVWVGAKLKISEMRNVIDLVRENPDLFIVQKYTPLSILNDQIVDLRSITAVMPNQILVADSPWGRGLPLDGNGKVNLSDQGREVTIFTLRKGPSPAPILCKKLRVN